MSDEPTDLRKAIAEYAQALRDDYTRRMNEPTQYVLPPRVYDEAQRQIKAGTAKPETIVVMRDVVRGELWTDEQGKAPDPE